MFAAESNKAFIIASNASIALRFITISNLYAHFRESIGHCAISSTLVYAFAQRFAISHLVNLLLNRTNWNAYLACENRQIFTVVRHAVLHAQNRGSRALC